MAEFKERLANLQALYDDGLITQIELQERRRAMIDGYLASTESRPPTEGAAPPETASFGGQQPEPKKKGFGTLLLVVGGVLVVALFGASLLDGGANSGSSTTPRADVATSSAQGEVDGTLLGDAWIGSGSYTVLATSKATGTDAGEPFQVYAARIDAPGAEDLCLFWYADGARLGEGMIIGDTVTRQFSEWGSAAAAGSAAADVARAASRTPEGLAVIRAIGC